MQDGIVKWFDNKKGYGFIQSDKKEYFVHHKEIQGNGFKCLIEGQAVRFEPATSSKGNIALTVIIGSCS